MTKKQSASQHKSKGGKENILELQFYVWIINFKSLAHTHFFFLNFYTWNYLIQYNLIFIAFQYCLERAVYQTNQFRDLDYLQWFFKLPLSKTPLQRMLLSTRLSRNYSLKLACIKKLGKGWICLQYCISIYQHAVFCHNLLNPLILFVMGEKTREMIES